MRLEKTRTQIQQIRNATIKLSYGGYIFLIDPWLAPKGATGSLLDFNRGDFEVKELVKRSIRMPICDLPLPVTEILEDVNFYIITHLHPDHFDMDNHNEVLDRNIPIFIQNNTEADFMKNLGFKNIKILQENGSFLGKVKLTRVEALHGSVTPCGPASGLIFEAEGEPTIYFAGDTIMYDGVKSVIEKFKPDIIILKRV